MTARAGKTRTASEMSIRRRAVPEKGQRARLQAWRWLCLKSKAVHALAAREKEKKGHVLEVTSKAKEDWTSEVRDMRSRNIVWGIGKVSVCA